MQKTVAKHKHRMYNKAKTKKGFVCMNKCFVAVSGGVDSAVALMLLKNKGYDVEGITMVPFGRDLVPNASTADAEDAEKLCRTMGIPHSTIDLSVPFRERVIADFISAYAMGETPNPCIVCNKHIKFGALADIAYEKGGDFYATGHYVRTETQNSRTIILRAADSDKDQSYMLWSLTPHQLSRFIAPLGGYSKKEVRAMAEEMGIEVAHKSDSQDICFIPDGDYRAFLQRVAPINEKEGDFVLSDGTRLGKHKGQSAYTMGQRKGLGIAHKEPLYVIGRDLDKNTVILGSNQELFTNRFVLRECNFSACDYPLSDMECEIRIRYRAPFVSAKLIPLGDGRIAVETGEQVRAVTPGQSAVFYSGDVMLGGGIICG